MPESASSTDSNAPGLGGRRRKRDPRLWAALLAAEPKRREAAARTVRGLEAERWYARQIIEALPELHTEQRLRAGYSLSLLGDIRFSAPYYLPEMLCVPSGTAILGSTRYTNERPRHRVEADGFMLAQFPVTQVAYAVFVNETGHRKPPGWRRGKPMPAQRSAPVVHVSARDAEAYCRWLSDKTGYEYRLPTEAEWVLAARGSNDSRAYPWGNEFQTGRANTWESRADRARLCAVGLFPEGSGPYGHEDLAGNVWEWCSSLFWAYPYNAGDGREDSGTDIEQRVMHGGSWRSRPVSVRCSARQGERPTDRFGVVGFRVARTMTHGTI